MLGQFAIAFAILTAALILGRDIKMALDTSAFNDALQAVADGLNAVAESIANPPAGEAAAQAVLNDAAAKLQGFASQLTDMKAAEDAEDAG